MKSVLVTIYAATVNVTIYIATVHVTIYAATIPVSIYARRHERHQAPFLKDKLLYRWMETKHEQRPC
jgi:hypothetical protein